jgi:hypothetical protein
MIHLIESFNFIAWLHSSEIFVENSMDEIVSKSEWRGREWPPPHALSNAETTYQQHVLMLIFFAATPVYLVAPPRFAACTPPRVARRRCAAAPRGKAPPPAERRRLEPLRRRGATDKPLY